MTTRTGVNSNPAKSDPSPAPGGLTLWDAVCIIVGIIIGTAIFQAPPDIFGNVTSPGMGIVAWLIGGVVSLLGALCYAELATTYRTSGGDYTWLTRAYGRPAGFLFAWAELAVIRTGGSIAFMAYVVANYANELVNLTPTFGQYGTLVYAVGSIAFLTLINLLGMQPGKHAQNLLTATKVVGLLAIAIVGLGCYFAGYGANTPNLIAGVVQASADETSTSVSIPTTTSFALAMVFVFYAYGGWNEAAFVAAEVQNPRRNIVRALVLGTITVTVIYLLVNLAYLGALGYRGVCESKAVASDVMALRFGDNGRIFMSVLVIISALGAINGLLFTGMRLYSTFGAEHRLFAWLSPRKSSRSRVSIGALVAQAAFSILLIVLIEFAHIWREVLSRIAPYLQLSGPDTFHQSGSIYQLVNCTAPVFWLFFLLTGMSLFVLRIRDPQAERPYRVPFFPVVPMIFCGMCVFMLYRSTEYALEQEPAEAIVVAGLVLVGIPLYACSGHAKISPTHAATRT